MPKSVDSGAGDLVETVSKSIDDSVLYAMETAPESIDIAVDYAVETVPKSIDNSPGNGHEELCDSPKVPCHCTATRVEPQSRLRSGPPS